MAKPKKAPSPAAEAVAAARAVVDQLAQRLAEASADVKRMEVEVAAARQALRDAMIAADVDLPQCRMVSVQWRSGTEVDTGHVVILKKTPSGTLVARRVGDEGGAEYRFKWAEHRAKFVQAEKSKFFGSSTRELRDVPAAFLPITSQGTEPTTP